MTPATGNGNGIANGTAVGSTLYVPALKLRCENGAKLSPSTFAVSWTLRGDGKLVDNGAGGATWTRVP